MKTNILGATGQLGRKVVGELLSRGVTPIASVRHPEKAGDLADRGIEVRHADYEQPASLHAAFRDDEVLLLIPTTAAIEPRIQQHHNALEAARSAGIGRVVFASFMAATPESRFLIAPFLLYAESKLRLSGLDWTILRNGMYLDPIADWIPELVRMGRLPYPVRRGRVAYISRDDLARATATVCAGSGHSRQLYKLTGSEAVSMPELAEAVSHAAGKTVAFESVDEEGFAEICRTGDESPRMTDVLISMYRAVEDGEFSEVTDDVERLTGFPPETVGSYLRRVATQSDAR